MASWRTRLLWIGAGLGLAVLVGKAMRRVPPDAFKGQVVLITGASRGLGLAMAHEFARHGARLAICARKTEPLEVARHELAATGADVLALSCDIGKQQQVQKLIQQTIAHYGRIDVLVNNAGIISVGPMQTMTMDDYEEALNVMFWGALNPTFAVLPLMREQKSGKIVNITSIGGKVAVPHLLPYSCAKFATVGFSEGLGAEMDSEGIDVITIVHGLMRTGSHVNAFMKGKQDAEYAWFGMGATLPFSAMNAAEAARQIVWATYRGKREHIISLQAQVLARLHGLFPELVIAVLERVNRILPGAGEGGTDRRSGKESRSKVTSLLTRLGEPAAQKYNQYTPQK